MDIVFRRLLLKNNFETLNALAKYLSIDNSALAAIINGSRHGYKHRTRIAKALHVKESVIFKNRKENA